MAMFTPEMWQEFFEAIASLPPDAVEWPLIDRDSHISELVGVNNRIPLQITSMMPERESADEQRMLTAGLILRCVTPA